MFKHILVAHDLSREADIALHRAIQLARQHADPELDAWVRGVVDALPGD